MTINKIDPVWASDGTSGYTTPPATSKVKRGWAPGEQPANSYENWSKNRLENKINETIDEVTRCSEDEIVNSIVQNCSGLPSSGIGVNATLHPIKNRKAVFNEAFMCRGYDYSRNCEVVFSLGRTDPTHLTVFYNSAHDDETDHDWATASITLTGPTSSDKSAGICCDGLYIYTIVNYSDGSASKIYKYALSDTNIVTAAPAASLELGETALFRGPETWASSGISCRQICVADAKNVAIVDYANNTIGIIPKTLVSPTYGSGQLTTIGGGTAHVQPRGICSDGTRIWAIATLSHIDYFFATLIDDPTQTDAGLTNIPHAVGNEQHTIRDLVFDGYHIAVASLYAATAGTSHGAFVSLYATTTESWYPLRYRIVSGSVAPASNVYYNILLAFTGRRIAVMVNTCPVSDLTEPNLFTYFCDVSQISVFFINPDVAGINVISSQPDFINDHVIQIYDDMGYVINPATINTTYAGVPGSLVYADGCVWALDHHYTESTKVWYASHITRITSACRR